MMDLSKQDVELLAALKLVRAQPGIWLQGGSFERLVGFINGFLWGRFPDESDPVPMLDRFQVWLRKQHGLGDWAAWPAIIRLLGSGDQHALEVFFKQLDAFLKDDQSS